MTSAMEGHENTSGTSGSSTTKATASGELVEEKSNSESKEEFNLAFKDILFESYRRMHVQCMRETGSVSELASLKKQGYALNQQQDKLLKNSEKLSRQIGDTLKTLQGLRGKKRKMDLRLSNLQRQTSSLTSKIQDEESRLEKIRTEGYDSRKSFTTEVFRAYSAYCMNIQSLTKSEGAKREKLEAEVKRLAENLESEKAECLKLETDVKLSEENLETEKTKRARLEEVAELFEQNLGSEKAKRLKLEADVKLTAQNLETETTKRVRLEEEAKDSDDYSTDSGEDNAYDSDESSVNFLQCYEADAADLEAYHEEIRSLYISGLESENEKPVQFQGAEIYNLPRPLTEGEGNLDITPELPQLESKKGGDSARLNGKFADLLEEAKRAVPDQPIPEREDTDIAGATTFKMTEGMIRKED
ncbi:hypothetical protein R1sor_019407 [Riccia sorocarpa]|uniref:Uncharacterized protein n=1 Tax=Riccia sorocarpa TaxID=122646 RepID=A0ABD3ICF5_9MARC